MKSITVTKIEKGVIEKVYALPKKFQKNSLKLLKKLLFRVFFWIFVKTDMFECISLY